MKLYTIKIEDLVEHPDYLKYFKYEKDKYYFELSNDIGINGILQPLIVNEKTSYILDGHKRFFIAKDIGIKYILCIIIKIESSEKEIEKLIIFNKFRQTSYHNTIICYDLYKYYLRNNNVS